MGTWGSVCKADGDNQLAIQAYEGEMRICRAPFEKAPWHWYLRSNVGGALLHLSELYERVGDVENEVRSRQGYLRVWGGYFLGVKTAGYIDPDPPPSDAEARRLRELMKKMPGMKRFTVPCDFNGLKYPFHIYISENPWPNDPLEDQARWLDEVRGGKIPAEVRESFRKLHKIAHDNNVSFQDLCVYALGAAASTSITLVDGQAQIQGDLITADAKDQVRKNSYCKVYTLSMAAGRQYQIDMTSDKVDPYLRLEGPDGKEVASDDDGGGGLNARILFQCPSAGTYRVIATTFAGGSGSFQLKVSER